MFSSEKLQFKKLITKWLKTDKLRVLCGWVGACCCWELTDTNEKGRAYKKLNVSHEHLWKTAVPRPWTAPITKTGAKPPIWNKTKATCLICWPTAIYMTLINEFVYRQGLDTVEAAHQPSRLCQDLPACKCPCRYKTTSFHLPRVSYISTVGCSNSTRSFSSNAPICFGLWHVHLKWLHCPVFS